MKSEQFAQVAINTPLRSVFDYRIPDTSHKPAVGARVLVPFGKRQVVGVVMRLTLDSQVAPSALKSISELIDDTPLFDAQSLQLIEWAAAYYQCPIGVAVFAAIPPGLRKAIPASIQNETITRYYALEGTVSARAHKQQAIHTWLQNHPGQNQTQIEKQFPGSKPSLKRLQEQNLLKVKTQIVAHTHTVKPSPPVTLNTEQSAAVQAIECKLNTYQVSLLEGVTGSGKTEVYFSIIKQVLAQNEFAQILILVPEIGLAPQLLTRITTEFNVAVGALHSNLNEGERKNTWLKIRAGQIDIIIGTRLAVFTPIPNLKLIVVDEEHDVSLKQQEGFMYNARDLAIYRAKLHNVPIILGSATPSFESLHNVTKKKYQHLILTQRAQSTAMPKMHLVDMRNESAKNILSSELRHKMQTHLEQGKQVILFLNRRGYAPALICHECGWVADCSRCDANMTFHSSQQKLICHHCDRTTPVPKTCSNCGSDALIPIGHGTQRVEEVVAKDFAAYSSIRLDRDISQKKGQLESAFKAIKNKEYQIILGTQLLSKGHDFPEVTLVGVLDIDYGIYSADFRALERTAQLLTQVAGRSGRRQQQGEVIVQTHAPEHPMLNILLDSGYATFAKLALNTRREFGLPPYQHQLALRARAPSAQTVFDFLHQAKRSTCKFFNQDIHVIGPMSAVMEKKAGQHRAYLMLTSEQRNTLNPKLNSWLEDVEKLPEAKKVRWTIDVDPLDNF